MLSVMNNSERQFLCYVENSFCFRWPAVICDDPTTGQYLRKDASGLPSAYHVEYLGDRHSHSWVKTGWIDIYGRVDPADSDVQTKRISGRLCKVHGNFITPVSQSGVYAVIDV